MIPQNIQEEVKKLLAKGKLEEALNLLHKTVKDADIINQLILISGRYSRLKQLERSGQIDEKQSRLEYNSLSAGVLSIVDEKGSQSSKITSYKFSEIFYLSLARIMISQLLMANQDEKLDLHISEITRRLKKSKRKTVVQVLKEMEEVGFLEKRKRDMKSCYFLNKEGIDFFESRK